jgi:hypothetical protein
MRQVPRVKPKQVAPAEAGAGQWPVALLQALHLLTRDGQLNQDARRKLKQVEHLLGFVAEPLGATGAETPRGHIVDFGAGKSYLGFLLYQRFVQHMPQHDMVAIEWRSELVAQSQALAAGLGFERMHFLSISADQAASAPELPHAVHMVTALHACDTATDDAIAFALARQAQHVLLVPCCQAEVARHLTANKAFQLARTPLAELWRHPLHTREMGSQITNVLRCLYLQACGYQVTVTELVGWQHSVKNELILARRTGLRQKAAAERMRAIAAEFGLNDLLPTRFAHVPPAA